MLKRWVVEGGDDPKKAHPEASRLFYLLRFFASNERRMASKGLS